MVIGQALRRHGNIESILRREPFTPDPRDAEELFRSHVLGTRAALRAARAAGVPRTVIASTSGTVGISEDPTRMATEDDPPPTALIQRFPYYRAKLYADIAHPINSTCREMIQDRVIKEFRLELERSKLPGYRSTYDDYDHEDAPAPKEPSMREKTHVQPAEPQPRSPHRPAAQQPARHAARHAAAPPSAPPTSGTPHDSFGAGIF